MRREAGHTHVLYAPGVTHAHLACLINRIATSAGNQHTCNKTFLTVECLALTASLIVFTVQNSLAPGTMLRVARSPQVQVLGHLGLDV